MNDKLSQLTTPQLLAIGLAAVMKTDIRTVLEVDAEMNRRKREEQTLTKDEEFFTMESKQEAMKLLKRVMA